MRSADDIVREVVDLFGHFGDQHFGEVTSQRQHALQAAALAQDGSLGDDLVVASLLHDIGHLVAAGKKVAFSARRSVEDVADVGPSEEAGRAGGDEDLDDHHESLGARWLAPRFGPRIARAVALHVVAKRYQCTVDAGYHDLLSDASRRSLQIQGGPLTPAEVERFSRNPAFRDALDVRHVDELAKSEVPSPLDLDAFVPVMKRAINSS